eukprot:m51a1_g2517 hypothetical protein (267) ;mRNA; r:197162-197962
MTGCFFLGDVQNVIQGRVPAELRGVGIDTQRFHCGFEIGDVSPAFAGLGEMTLVGRRAYLRSTDRSRPDYLKTLNTERLYTTGAVFVPTGATPSATIDVDAPTVWLDVLQRLHAANARGPLMFCGFVHFSRMRATYITRSPVDGKNIFENKSEFFDDGNQVVEDVWAAAVGCVHLYGQPATPADVEKELTRVLYRNPNEVSAAELSVHTHVVTLNGGREAVDRAAGNVESLRHEDAKDSWHLLSDSVADYARIEVFGMSSLSQLKL